MRAFKRWWYTVLTYRDYNRMLNRQVVVEQHLLDCYHGKRPLPDREGCLKLAQQLGKER